MFRGLKRKLRFAALLRKVGTLEWQPALQQYLASRESLKHEIARKRNLARVPVTLPDGSQVALSPGGQNPLIKAIIEQRFLGPYPDVTPKRG